MFEVPDWVLDDVEYFYPEVEQYKKGNQFPISYKETFNQYRKQIYWLCHWYPELDLPMIPSTIYDTRNDIHEVYHLLHNHLKHHFVRYCNASPKDVVEPIFKCPDEAIDALESSPRTNYMLDNEHHTHLILRPVVPIDHEVRCFWHQYKLRAVSGPYYYIVNQEKIKNLVLSFFKKYQDKIIYNSATLDLGIKDDDVFLIEINSFGIDMLATGGQFKWKEDYHILHHAEEPVFRFKKEFEW